MCELERLLTGAVKSAIVVCGLLFCGWVGYHTGMLIYAPGSWPDITASIAAGAAAAIAVGIALGAAADEYLA